MYLESIDRIVFREFKILDDAYINTRLASGRSREAVSNRGSWCLGVVCSLSSDLQSMKGKNSADNVLDSSRYIHIGAS